MVRSVIDVVLDRPDSDPPQVYIADLTTVWRSTIAPRRDLRLGRLDDDALDAVGLQRAELTDADADTFPDTVRWAEHAHRHGATDGHPLDGLIWHSRRAAQGRAARDLVAVLFGDRVARKELRNAGAPVPLVAATGSAYPWSAERHGVTSRAARHLPAKPPAYSHPVAERRPWRQVDGDLFRFTTTELRELHVAVMSAFHEAAVLAPALNLDDVRTAVAAAGWDEPLTDDALHQVLESLVRWQLLDATQDHGAQYATPEEFERKNLQWSLTHRGESAIGGVLHALDALRRAVGLQPALLDAVGDALADLAALLAEPLTAPSHSDVDARLHLRLADVEAHLAALVQSVRQFNGHLQRLLREDAVDDTVFLDVKRRTVTYLEEYVAGVERARRRLHAGIERVERLGLATLFDRALRGANLAPVAGVDPGPEWLADRARRWDALRAWFAGATDAAPRLDGLVGIARTAILELLRVLERRWDSRRRSTSVANDFRRLAALFATAPGDAEAHRLFCAAFGMWPSRHAHLPPPDGEARSSSTSWAVSTPVEVAPSLRTTGTVTNRGRVRPVADPAAVRAARLHAEAIALGAHEELRRMLATDGAVRLGTFGELPADAFAELLALLAAGLEAPLGADGARRTMSIDGRVEVVLVDPGDGRTATLTTVDGALHGPDLLVSITLHGAAPEPARLAGSEGRRA